jgi:hypothetical protein
MSAADLHVEVQDGDIVVTLPYRPHKRPHAKFLGKNSRLAGGAGRIRTLGPVGKICL